MGLHIYDTLDNVVDLSIWKKQKLSPALETETFHRIDSMNLKVVNFQNHYCLPFNFNFNRLLFQSTRDTIKKY